MLKTAAITSVPCEFALVELEDAASAQAVAEIFQARIDAQINGGAFYPMTVEGWQKAEIITQGAVVAAPPDPSPRPSWRGCCPRPETP